MNKAHPAAIALGVLCVLFLFGLVWSVAAMQDAEGRLQWTGETPSPEVMRTWALFNFGYSLALPALGLATAASGLGLVLVWCLPRLLQRGTRTMSAAGSTWNRAATTVPNSSPSISNSSGSASISMSTARPRE
jgi:hypothetical protein